jgi:hypothetical protein
VNSKSRSNEPVSRALCKSLGAGLAAHDGEAATSALPRRGKSKTHAHQKEIVSAMVRMNT